MAGGRRRAVGDLHQPHRTPGKDQEPATWGKRDRLPPPEERPLGRVAAHQQPWPAELPEPLEDGFEPRPRGPGDPPGQDEMEAEFPAQPQEVDQRQQRAPAGRREQVVVVDQQDVPWPPPGGAGGTYRR
jgi:hypothetical protein